MIYLCWAFPSSDIPPSLKQIDNNYDIEEFSSNFAVIQGRQSGFLGALGGLLSPFFSGIFGPLVSQLADAVTSAVLGRLQGKYINI